jgi:tRNA-(ms[2]io[6]A)-hydroxylase
MMQIQLSSESSSQWLTTVLENFDDFLLDHGANEKKAAGVALNLAAHYPDKPDLVAAMIDLAIEELSHYREVFKLIRERQLSLVPDQKDAYVNQLRTLVRHGREDYFLDRLLIAGIIETRGLERFGKIATALAPGPLKSFYQSIAHSEARHGELFLGLAYQYCDDRDCEDQYCEDREGGTIASRLQILLEQEAEILASLALRPALH